MEVELLAMSDTSTQEAPATKRKLSPEHLAALAKGRAAAAAKKKDGEVHSASPRVVEEKRREPPVVEEDQKAEIERLRAQVAALLPKPVDIAKLARFEVYCELGFAGKRDDQDNPVAETMRDPEDKRWDELRDVKSVFPSLVINELIRNGYVWDIEADGYKPAPVSRPDLLPGEVVERKQVRGMQMRNVRMARDAWRSFKRDGTIDGIRVLGIVA